MFSLNDERCVHVYLIVEVGGQLYFLAVLRPQCLPHDGKEANICWISALTESLDQSVAARTRIPEAGDVIICAGLAVLAGGKQYYVSLDRSERDERERLVCYKIQMHKKTFLLFCVNLRTV